MTCLHAATDEEEMRVRRLAVASQAREAAEAKAASEAVMQVVGIVYLRTGTKRPSPEPPTWNEPIDAPAKSLAGFQRRILCWAASSVSVLSQDPEMQAS